MRYLSLRSPFVRFTLAFLVGAGVLLVFQSPYRRYVQRRFSHAIDPEEYAVYSAVIGEMIQDRPYVELIVIGDRTSTEDSYTESLESKLKQVEKQMPELEPSTLKDFRVQNENPARLEPRLKLEKRYALVSIEDVAEFFKEGGGQWDAFYEKYPQSQGIMQFSRVGFNPAMNQALVYVGNLYANLAGAGGFVMLTRKNGIWTPGAYVTGWVS